MVTSEQEHDFVEWGLQLFNSDPYANCGYCGVLTHENGEYYNGNSFKEDDHYDAGECCNVENDEAIAHTLQLQELSKLAVVGSPSQGEEEELQLQVCGYTRDCINQSVGDFGSGIRKFLNFRVRHFEVADMSLMYCIYMFLFCDCRASLW